MQPESGPSQKTHAAAVIGLACSVVICCPVTSLVEDRAAYDFQGATVGWLCGHRKGIYSSKRSQDKCAIRDCFHV